MKPTEYSKYISDIIYDTQNYEVEMLFYLTRHCNLKCPGCYMQSSPETQKSILSLDDLDFYLNEFNNIENFTQSVVFSGGEIFTAPIEYIKKCSDNVLNRGWELQIKTNGTWVQDKQKSGDILKMLRQLKPLHGYVASEQEIQNTIKKYPRWLLNICGNILIKKHLTKSSALSMAISVDDKLHPAQSADWFIKIANAITADKKLRKNVNLKTFTFFESVPLLESRVLNNPELHIKNFELFENKQAARYTIKDTPVESYVGEFIDVKSIPTITKLSEIAVSPIGDAKGRLVYCFYPDGTVGFDCNYLESVGRVSYINKNKEHKTFKQIQHDIHKQLVNDYTRAIQK